MLHIWYIYCIFCILRIRTHEVLVHMHNTQDNFSHFTPRKKSQLSKDILEATDVVSLPVAPWYDFAYLVYLLHILVFCCLFCIFGIFCIYSAFGQESASHAGTPSLPQTPRGLATGQSRSAGPVGRKPAAPDTVTVGLFLESDEW